MWQYTGRVLKTLLQEPPNPTVGQEHLPLKHKTVYHRINGRGTQLGRFEYERWKSNETLDIEWPFLLILLTAFGTLWAQLIKLWNLTPLWITYNVIIAKLLKIKKKIMKRKKWKLLLSFLLILNRCIWKKWWCPFAKSECQLSVKRYIKK